MYFALVCTATATAAAVATHFNIDGVGVGVGVGVGDVVGRHGQWRSGGREKRRAFAVDAFMSREAIFER